MAEHDLSREYLKYEVGETVTSPTPKNYWRYKFAGMAMQGILSTKDPDNRTVKNVAEEYDIKMSAAVALISVRMADALLAELAKGKE